MDNDRSYKRRTFFIKKTLQVHFAFISFMLMLFSTLGVWVLMNIVFRFFLAERWGGMPEEIFFNRTNILVLVFILADGVAVFFLSIYFSHFIAGPIYHLEKNLRNILDGKPVEKIHLRKHDHLKDTMILVNELIQKFVDGKK